MVVLELEGHTNMLGSGPNQYLQPDYLSPLSSPLDSKASPLALLAQTCSQIGSDGPTSKSIFESSKRKLSTCSESSLKSDSSSDSTTSNHKDGSGSSNNKESNNGSGGGSGNSNNNYRQKSGSSSVSPFNHVPTTKSSGDSRKSSSPVLISPTSSPVFKPYEMSKPHKDSASERSSEKSVSKSSKHGSSSSSFSRNSANSSPKVKTPNPRSTPPESKEISVVDTKKASSSSSGSGATDPSKSSSSSSDHGASPIIRSGLEVLQQGQFGSTAAAAEYNKRLSALTSLSALGAAAGYPPGFDPLNPAFRPPFFGSPHSHHAGLGYPFPGQSPYVSYSRVKTASGAETIVPVCKDPYCTGCQYGGGGVPHGSPASSGASSLNNLMAAAAAAATAVGFPPSITGSIPGLCGTPPTSGSSSNLICPAGCVHPCEHPKFPLSSLPHLFPQMTSSLASGGYPSSLLSQHSAAAAAASAQATQNAQRPYVCNWIAGDNYCGKRFPSSEELLQHLRTHTNSSTGNGSTSSSSTSSADAAALAHMVQQQQQQLNFASPYSSAAALLNPSAMAAAAVAFSRSYPTPPLSPLSAARYHPYAAAAQAGKASSLSAGLVPPPMPPTSSAAAAALSNYYPYSAAAAAALYGQRLGPSVHP